MLSKPLRLRKSRSTTPQSECATEGACLPRAYAALRRVGRAGVCRRCRRPAARRVLLSALLRRWHAPEIEDSVCGARVSPLTGGGKVGGEGRFGGGVWWGGPEREGVQNAHRGRRGGGRRHTTPKTTRSWHAAIKLGVVFSKQLAAAQESPIPSFLPSSCRPAPGHAARGALAPTMPIRSDARRGEVLFEIQTAGRRQVGRWWARVVEGSELTVSPLREHDVPVPGARRVCCVMLAI